MIIGNISVRSNINFSGGPPSQKKWKLVWSDEFNDTTLDTIKWLAIPEKAWLWPGIKTKLYMPNIFLDGNGSVIVQLSRDPGGTVCYPGHLISRFQKACTRYPELAHLAETPSRNTITRNLVCRCTKFIGRGIAFQDIKDNLETAEDPGFVDPMHGNFGLKDNSIVYKKIPGFEKIPFEKIGLYKDEYRTRFPVEREYNTTQK